jgi:hypothetical protein
VDVTALLLYRQYPVRVHTDATCVQTAWLGFEEEESISYDRPTGNIPLSVLSRASREEELGSSRRVQQDILQALGLGYLGFVDEDFQDVFESIPTEESIHTVRKQILQLVLEKQIKKFDECGTSTGIDLEKAAKHKGIAERVDQILHEREKELQRLVIFSNGTEVDLQALWLTHYGFEILSASKVGLFTDVDGWNQLKATFEEVGYGLETTDKIQTSEPVNFSKELKEVIWFIARNTGRKIKS